MKAASGVRLEPWWLFCLPMNEPHNELALHGLTCQWLALPVYRLSQRCDMF